MVKIVPLVGVLLAIPAVAQGGTPVQGTAPGVTPRAEARTVVQSKVHGFVASVVGGGAAAGAGGVAGVAPARPGQGAVAYRYASEADLAAAMKLVRALGDTKVDLALENVSVRDALKQIFEQAKLEYEVEGAVAEEPKVTLRAKGAKLSTALNLVTELAGLGWRHEVKNGKALIRVGKDIRTASFDYIWRQQPLIVSPDGQARSALRIPSGSSILQVPYVSTVRTERVTFSCPHCKGQSTLVRTQQQPLCTKCNRAFQSDWEFCPADGAKRPTAPTQWKYCPHCGKQVDLEKLERAEREQREKELREKSKSKQDRDSVEPFLRLERPMASEFDPTEPRQLRRLERPGSGETFVTPEGVEVQVEVTTVKTEPTAIVDK